MKSTGTIDDDLLVASHVTPTQTGRLLVFAEGLGYPITVLDELPAEACVIVEPDASIYLDPATVEVVIDPVFFAQSKRDGADQ